MKKQIVASAGFIAWIVSHSVCIAQERSAALPQWPAASVERPLTLLEDLGQWRVWSFFSNRQNWSWFPLAFEQGVSDAFTLVWLPIPIEARVRLYADLDRRHQLALTVNLLGAVTSQTANFNWSPFLALDYRLRPLESLHRLIVDFRWTAMMELRREVRPLAATFVLEALPRFQPWDWLWFAAGPSLWWELGAPRSFYWGASPQDQGALRVPLSMSLGLSLWNRLDFDNRVSWLTLGFPEGFSQLQWASSLAFWF